MNIQREVESLNLRRPHVAPEAESSEGLDLNALARFFLRRRWLMIGVGAFVAFWVLLAIMIQPPKFASSATLMISPRGGDIVSGGGQTGASAETALDTGSLESQIEILTSRKLMGALADRLKLVSDPNWNSMLKPKLFGAKPTPSKDPKVLAQQREWVIDALGGAITARRKGLTYVIEVHAESRNPRQAAQMANTVISLYFESQVQMRFEAGEQANSWLADRLASLKTEVQQKEAATEAYRSSSGLLAAAGASLTEQQVTGLQTSVIAARTDLAERQARYAQVQSLLRTGGSVDSIAGVINSGTIQTLRAQEAGLAREQADLESRYGELHPAIAKVRVERQGIEQQIKAETARISANLKNEVDVAQARLGTLLANQQSVQGQLASNNEGMVKLRELERDAGATRAIYESFLKRYQEISESQSLKVTDAHLVASAPVPTSKASPKLSLALLLGMVVGLVVGVAAGLIVDLTDEGLDSADAVERETGKQVLAAIPVVWPEDLDAAPITSVPQLLREGARASSLSDLRRIGKRARKLFKQGNMRMALGMRPKGAAQKEAADVQDAPLIWHPAEYLVEKPMSAFAEGFRALRASLLYSGMDRNLKVVAVASAMPGEGKTTTSVGLARVAGLSGQKVIVVDCDMRRRSLNGILKLSPKIGLLQVLTGQFHWKEAVIEDKSTSIHVLPATEASFTPLDVFGSPAMKQLIQDLGAEYDLVILDCPPVLAVAEARIICRLADETVLVVRWAQTPARAALGAIEQIEQCGGSVVGVAINCVDPNAPGRGSYGDMTYQARYAGEYYLS